MNRLAVLTFLLVSTINTAIGAEQASIVYTVGVVPQFEIRKLHGIWRPVLDLLEKKTGYKFALRGSVTIPMFEHEFIQGKFDFAYMNPYHLVIANDYAGYIPLVRDHGLKLYGVLVVKKDSGITSPAQLEGKILAFPAPNALGASLLIRRELVDNYRISFESTFVKTHDSVYLNVLLGKASAGGGVQKTLNRQKKEVRESLRVIHKTGTVNPHPFAALPKIPVEVRERVRDAFLEIGQSKEGQHLLSRIPMDKVGPATINDYLPLKGLGLERFHTFPSQK